MVFFKRNRWRILSVPVSVLAVVFAYLLNIPNPMMVLIIPVVVFSYADGYIGGALSGLISIAYSLIFFSNNDKLFANNEENIQKILTIVAAVTVIVIFMGQLKARTSIHHDEMSRLNNNFFEILSGMDASMSMLSVPLFTCSALTWMVVKSITATMNTETRDRIRRVCLFPFVVVFFISQKRAKKRSYLLLG